MNTIRVAGLCAVCSVPSVAAYAQVVWPAGYASTAGNAVLNSPFSSPPGHATTRTRMMVVIEPSSLPFAGGTVLTKVSLRRDVGYAGQAYAGLSGSLQVRIGRVLATPTNVRDVRFDRLWEGTPTTVYSSSQFAAPPAPAPGSAVPPFNLVVPFTVNHQYQGGPLGIEFLFTPSGASSTWRVDAFRRPSPQNGTSHSAGGGCAGSNGFVPAHHVLPETARPGAVLKTQLEGIHSGQGVAFHMLGLQDTTWLGLPLPLTLGVFGGPPGCLLRMEPIVITTVPTSNPSALFDRATSTAQVPALASAAGMQLFSQWLVFDAGVAAQLQVAVSDMQRITLGPIAPAPAVVFARTIWKYGATGFDSDGGRMVLDDYGPVLRFN